MTEAFGKINENLLAFYRYVAEQATIPFGEEDFLWVKNAGGKWPKWVVGQNFDEARIEEAALQTIARMKEHELPPYWNVIPGKGQLAMRAILEENRFREVYRWTGMALELSDYKAEKQNVTDLVIREVSTEEDLEEFVGVLNSTVLEASNMELELAQKLLHSDSFRMLIGIFDGKVVATGALFISGDTAGIYFIATLDEARRKGIGTAITRACLDLALERELATVILHASRMGEPIYRNIGFSVVENSIFNIYWLVGREYR